MRVRWTTDAADDLERISDYIAEDRPETARRIALDIVRTVDALDTFPNRGRPGRVEGTRELVLAPLPFIAIYEVHEEEVQVSATDSCQILEHSPRGTTSTAATCLSVT